MRPARQKQQYNYEGKLTVLAFVVLLGFSIISVGTWRWPNTTFSSVHTRNLQPFVQHGDAVLAHPAKSSALHADDTITFYDPQNLTSVHVDRLTNIDPRRHTFTVTGNESNLLSTTLIIGKVQYKLQKCGYILDFVRSKLGLIIGIYVPAIIIVGSELRELSDSFGRKRYRLFFTSASRL